jgi:hypothetical protein
MIMVRIDDLEHDTNQESDAPIVGRSSELDHSDSEEEIDDSEHELARMRRKMRDRALIRDGLEEDEPWLSERNPAIWEGDDDD